LGIKILRIGGRLMIDVYKNKNVEITEVYRDKDGKCWVVFESKDPDDVFKITVNITESRYQTILNLQSNDVELMINCKLVIESKIM